MPLMNRLGMLVDKSLPFIQTLTNGRDVETSHEEQKDADLFDCGREDRLARIAPNVE